MTTPTDPPTRDEVMALLGRYAEAVCAFDLDLFASCWAADAVWEVPAAAPDRVGLDDIVELFGSLRAKFPLCMQQIMSVTFEPAADGDGVDARTHLCELQWREEGPGTELYGIYRDRIARRGDAVVFARRGFHALYRGRRTFDGRLTEGG